MKTSFIQFGGDFVDTTLANYSILTANAADFPFDRAVYISFSFS